MSDERTAHNGRYRVDERHSKDGPWWTLQERGPNGWQDIPMWGHAPIHLYSREDAEARLQWLLDRAV